MGARVIAVIGFIVFIAPTAERCEALFFTTARKLHSDEDGNRFQTKYPPSVAFSATRQEIIAGLPSRSSLLDPARKDCPPPPRLWRDTFRSASQKWCLFDTARTHFLL